MVRRQKDAEDNGADLLQFGAMGKAFTILDAISASGTPLSMAELARITGMTKPTAHRIVTVLAELGFVERDQSKRGFVEGPRLVRFALSALRGAAPRTMRHAVLRALSEETGETCNFGVLAGAEVIYVDRVEAKWPLGLRFEPGSHVPAHASAIGKLLLSLQDEQEQDQFLRSLPLAKFTSRTLTTQKDLAKALRKIRQTGIGTDDQEYIDGVVCVAVPVRADNGELLGGIAMSAPEARISIDGALRFVPSMKAAASRIGKTFKFGGPGGE
ncbi:MAG: IclR family transcriptional regulator [Pseudomonadota bacterium]|nr:IclR family transcriptional regulator [Pseudomonadota bacterium]